MYDHDTVNLKLSAVNLIKIHEVLTVGFHDKLKPCGRTNNQKIYLFVGQHLWLELI